MNKATGCDRIPPNMAKSCSKEMLIITELVSNAFIYKLLPDDIKRSIINNQPFLLAGGCSIYITFAWYKITEQYEIKYKVISLLAKLHKGGYLYNLMWENDAIKD